MSRVVHIRNLANMCPPYLKTRKIITSILFQISFLSCRYFSIYSNPNLSGCCQLALRSKGSTFQRLISNITTAPPGVIKIHGDILSNLYYSSRCMHKKDGKLSLILSPLLVSDPNHLLAFAGHGITRRGWGI